MIDTNIIIEILKGNIEVVEQISKLPKNDICISVITYAELIFGARNKIEQHKLEQKLQNIPILNIDIQISQKFLHLMESISLSHKLNIPDALIASTAIVYKTQLLTLNIKDFRYISEIKFYNIN